MNPDMMRQMVERMAAQRAGAANMQGMSSPSKTGPAPQGFHYMPDGTLMKDSDMGSQGSGAQGSMPTPGYERNNFEGANFINGGMGGNSSPAPTVPVRDSMENKDLQMAAFAREAARQQALKQMLANLVPASPTT